MNDVCPDSAHVDYIKNVAEERFADIDNIGLNILRGYATRNSSCTCQTNHQRKMKKLL